MQRKLSFRLISALKRKCGSISCISDNIYCLNNKAEDKKNGSIKKLEKVYFCCAMDSNENNYNFSKIESCPYKTLGIKIIQMKK